MRLNSHRRRGYPAGERNKDKREFLAFYWEVLEPAKDGTGPSPTGTRRAIIDTALGYFNCLNANEQKALAVKQAELLTRRKDVDGKHGQEMVQQSGCEISGPFGTPNWNSVPQMIRRKWREDRIFVPRHVINKRLTQRLTPRLSVLSEAGAAAVFRLPTSFQNVSPSIRQYLRQ